MNPAKLVDWIEPRDLPATALTVATAVLIADLAWAYVDRAKPDANNEDAVAAHAQRRRTRLIMGGIAGTVAFTVLLIWGPWWIEGHHLRNKDNELVSSAGIIITGFRTMLVALAAGGFTAAGLWYTHRSHQHTEKLFEHTREKDREEATLTREGQVTGRYVEAVKLVASEALQERLGGIYSLQRIMNDSEKDRAICGEVLAAFVRSNLGEGQSVPPELYRAPDEADSREVEGIPEIGRDENARIPLGDDVRAALEVLGRNWKPGDSRPNLRRIRLEVRDASEAVLTGAQLSRTWLAAAYLPQATLRHTDLRYAVLDYANLVRADMSNISAAGAHFWQSDLSRAILNHAVLSAGFIVQAKLHMTRLVGADLRGVLFNGSIMRGADLSGADCQEVDFSDVDLAEANLADAHHLTALQICRAQIYTSTQLPPGLAQDPEVQKRIQECERAKAKHSTPRQKKAPRT